MGILVYRVRPIIVVILRDGEMHDLITEVLGCVEQQLPDTIMYGVKTTSIMTCNNNISYVYFVIAG